MLLAEMLALQSELASLDPALARFAAAASPLEERLKLVRDRLVYVTQDIERLESHVDDLRHRADVDPIGDGQEPAAQRPFGGGSWDWALQGQARDAELRRRERERAVAEAKRRIVISDPRGQPVPFELE